MCDAYLKDQIDGGLIVSFTNDRSPTEPFAYVVSPDRQITVCDPDTNENVTFSPGTEYWYYDLSKFVADASQLMVTRFSEGENSPAWQALFDLGNSGQQGTIRNPSSGEWQPTPVPAGILPTSGTAYLFGLPSSTGTAGEGSKMVQIFIDTGDDGAISSDSLILDVLWYHRQAKDVLRGMRNGDTLSFQPETSLYTNMSSYGVDFVMTRS